MQPTSLAVIVGSVREGRFAPVVARWFVEHVEARGDFVVDLIDLADADLPADLSDGPTVRAFAGRIGAADAVVAITPEYNHGYPAALKTAFDSAKYEWRGKPIGFVAYGAVAGGLRAVEQLRQVVAELHMVSVRDAVSFHRARTRFDENGATDDDAARDACDRMLAQLQWWATATASVRSREPYPG